MAAQFDTLAAADALEDAGIDGKHARAIATQLRIVANTRKAVMQTEAEAALAPLATKAELEAGLGALKAELIERIAKTEKRMLQNSAKMERRLMERNTALIWRVVGAMVAVNALLVAAVKLIP